MPKGVVDEIIHDPGWTVGLAKARRSAAELVERGVGWMIGGIPCVGDVWFGKRVVADPPQDEAHECAVEHLGP